jgi:hypothetical protein
MFSNNRAVNILAAARVFLFASRDVWFVVGLPVFLYTVVGWNFWQVGAFMAIWIIGYGVVQASAPSFLRRRVEGQSGPSTSPSTGPSTSPSSGPSTSSGGTSGGTSGGAPGRGEPDGKTATWLAFALAAFPAGIALALMGGVDPAIVVVAGLVAFGIIFAMNSAVHSYLILAYTDSDTVAMNVGFYYMANAGGRLAGTVLSGLLYQWYGLVGCLWASVAFVLAAGLLSLLLPASTAPRTRPIQLGKLSD